MPLEDPTVVTPSTSDAVVQPVVAGKDVPAVDKIVADIKAHIPAMRFAYAAWRGYDDLPDSKIVEDRIEVIEPLLRKPEPLTDEETAVLFGAMLRIAVESGKDLTEKLVPIMGRDAIGILTALGLLV